MKTSPKRKVRSVNGSRQSGRDEQRRLNRALRVRHLLNDAGCPTQHAYIESFRQVRERVLGALGTSRRPASLPCIASALAMQGKHQRSSSFHNLGLANSASARLKSAGHDIAIGHIDALISSHLGDMRIKKGLLRKPKRFAPAGSPLPKGHINCVKADRSQGDGQRQSHAQLEPRRR